MPKKPSTKTRLITAATCLLDEGGPEAVTLRAVAQAVGVSHNAPYKHFKDKRAILAAVAEASFVEMAARFRETALKKATPLQALRVVVENYLSFARHFPARYRLLFSDPDISQHGGMLETEALETFETVANLVVAAQKSGELAKGDPARATALIYATAHGLADLELSGRTRAAKGLTDVDAVASLLLDLLTSTP
ncbi:TetR/AcrR family transcriptional regulator [Beijerinckia sp. L45]|uniref:TetR/AcrR family transcriptional regulator n=1 Tax=Beijerinckia sp. L45 TaxID=1641855 RepID=UPI00131E53E5|nr:TetR/AcrR family transcriptional regulator [Beijerinckia sp. L45]